MTGLKLKPLVLEATALPTELQPLPNIIIISSFSTSDPFAKVKVFVVGKTKPFKFETKTVWKNLAPVWNEK